MNYESHHIKVKSLHSPDTFWDEFEDEGVINEVSIQGAGPMLGEDDEERLDFHEFVTFPNTELKEFVSLLLFLLLLLLAVQFLELLPPLSAAKVRKFATF